MVNVGNDPNADVRLFDRAARTGRQGSPVYRSDGTVWYTGYWSHGSNGLHVGYA